jgi:hypothetical protein
MSIESINKIIYQYTDQNANTERIEIHGLDTINKISNDYMQLKKRITKTQVPKACLPLDPNQLIDDQSVPDLR